MRDRQRERERERARAREREYERFLTQKKKEMTLPWGERVWLPPHRPLQDPELGPLEVLEDTDERSGHPLCCSGIIQGALLDVNTELH